MASTYLTRTHGTPTNAKKHTFSVWVKLSLDTTNHDFMFGVYNGSSRNNYFIKSGSDNTLAMENVVGGNSAGYFFTNRKFRDCNAWYHIVVAEDTTQATASDRVKVYVNGVQETSFSSISYPSQNIDDLINSSGSTVYVGQRGGSYGYLDGSMSHMHFIDGTAYDATAFGEFDANGVWKIKTDVSVTYGTNGFFILKDGNSVTDQSGNSNNFTVGGGTLTNTEDSPSNVFATINPLTNFYQNSTFSNGNNRIVTTNDGVYNYNESTLGMSSGKYYMEVKYITSARPTNDFARFGIVNAPSNRTIGSVGYGLYEYGYYSYNGKIVNNDIQTNYGDTFTDNDIIGIAVDLDNNKLYFSKNGTWQNSGDPTSGSTGTGAISITPASDNDTGFYFFAGGEEDGTYGVTFETNFGNGYFGTTAVASAGTNASGNGIFEYDVPTGYTALSTKGLNL